MAETAFERFQRSRRTAEELPDYTSPAEGEEGSVLAGALGFAANVLIPGRSIVDRQRRLQEENPDYEPSGITRTAMGLTKGMTFNSVGLMDGVINAGQNALAGEDINLREEVGQSQEFVKENSNLGGEVVGSMIGAPAVAGVAAAQGLTKLPMLGRLLQSGGVKGVAARATGAAALAGADSAAYTALGGGTAEEVWADAQLGALVGGAASPLLGELLPSVLRKIGTVAGYGGDREAAQSLVNGIRRAYGDVDGVTDLLDTTGRAVTLDIDNIMARAANLPADSRLIDIIPDAMYQQLRQGTRGDKDMYDASRQLIKYLENRELAGLPRFRDAVEETFGRQGVRSMDAVRADAREATAALVPEYNRVLDDAQNAGVTFRSDDVRELIKAAFGRDTLPPVTARARDHVLAMVGEEGIEYTPRQLLTIRKDLDSVMYSGRLPDLGGGYTSSTIAADLRKSGLDDARVAIRNLLTENVEGLGDLDAQFADEITSELAHNAGYKLFRGRGATEDSFDIFQASVRTRSPRELQMFVEGTKQAIFEDLDKLASPRAVRNYVHNNQPKFDALASVVGDDAVEMFIQNIDNFAREAKLGTMLPDTPPADLAYGRNIPQKLTDSLVIAAGPTRYGSNPSMFGALRRSVPQGVGSVPDRAVQQSLSALAAAPDPRAVMGQANQQIQGILPQLEKINPQIAAMIAAGNSEQ